MEFILSRLPVTGEMTEYWYIGGGGAHPNVLSTAFGEDWIKFDVGEKQGFAKH